MTGVKNAFSLFINSSTEAKVLKATSSNSSVLGVKCGSSITSLKLTGKKEGTSTVALSYSCKGKKYSTSTKFTVSKSPVASFALNGKRVKLTDAYGYTLRNYKKSSAKFKLTPAKGWSIKRITYYNDKTNKEKKVSNGASVKTPKGNWTSWGAKLKSASGKAFYFYVSVEG